MEIALIFGALVVVSGLGLLLLRRKKSPPQLSQTTSQASAELATTSSPAAPTKATLFGGLSKTRSKLLAGLSRFKTPETRFDAKERESIEEALLSADVGFETASRLLDGIENQTKPDEISILDLIKKECEATFEATQKSFDTPPQPLVIMVVGVNGVGKTTTIGKLANVFKEQGKSVLLGAADTFRAGAISQLKVWSERVGTQFVAGREGGDPGAVAFDSVSAAKARNLDIAILDTAGRLHTKANLMDELKKVHRVMKKVIPEAPHETWLVIDGTLGQNSVRQAVEFHKALELSGVIVTKLDGTAKGGALLSLASELKLPIKYIGIGEQLGDLIPFEPKPFVEAIFG